MGVRSAAGVTPAAPAAAAALGGHGAAIRLCDGMAKKALIVKVYCCCGVIKTEIAKGKNAERIWYTLRFESGNPGGPRNWTEYSERLVERGSRECSLEWIHRMDEDLAEMNRGKRGAPFRYPDKMIEWARSKHAWEGKDYRSLEGELREIMKLVGKDAISYSQMFKRCRELDMIGPAAKELDPEWVRLKNMENSTVPGAVPKKAGGDSSGLKLTVRGEWMREKWKIHRGWVKIHILAGLETSEILSYSVTTEETGDPKMLLAMVDDAVARGHWIKKVYLDGAYDTIAVWKGLKARSIGFAVNIRRNASTRSRNGCPDRAAAVRVRNKIGDGMWKIIHGYPYRWKVESVFSDFKRVMGETLKAKSFREMVREIDSKIRIHNSNKNILWGGGN